MGRVAALAVLIAVALAGCGGSSSEDTPLQRQPTVAAQIPTDLTLTPKDAKRVAEVGVLRIEDFPVGWKVEPNDDDDDEDIDCEGIDEKVVDHSAADAYSGSFSDDTQFAANTVGVFATRDQAVSAMRILASERFARCFVEVFAKKGMGVDTGEVTVKEMTPPSLGEQASALQADVPIKTQGREIHLLIDVVSVRTGNAIDLGVFAGAVLAMNPKLEQALVKATVDRLTAAQAES